ncbi:hypothetical protein I160019C6_26610 [Bacteroides uniformis]
MCYWHVLWGYHDIQSNKNLFSNNNEYHSYCVLLTRYNNFQRTQIIKLHNYEKEKLQCNGTGSKSYHRQHELLEKRRKPNIY